MSDFNPYFHFNYSSSGVIGKYVKLSIVIPYYGICSAICNKSTKRVKVQTHKTTFSTRHYIGTTHNGLIVGLANLASEWMNIDYSSRELMYYCASHIFRAAKRLCKQLGGTSQFDSISNYASELYKQIGDLFHNCSCNSAALDAFSMPSPVQTKTAETETPATPVHEPEWVRYQSGSISEIELSKILDFLKNEGNPDNGVEYNGKRYRLFSENGYLLLKTRNSVATATGNATAEPFEIDEKDMTAMPEPPPDIFRNTKRMAFMVDDTDLTEFVKGCFYNICTDEIHEPDFEILLNSEGERRAVSQSRIEVVDVYTEPPSWVIAA